MGELSTLDHTGDSKTVWDKSKPDEVDTAREMFEKLKKKGYAAFRVKEKGDRGSSMRELDPTAEGVIMVPPMAGG